MTDNYIRIGPYYLDCADHVYSLYTADGSLIIQTPNKDQALCMAITLRDSTPFA